MTNPAAAPGASLADDVVPRAGADRFAELDALRGAAALCVCTSHGLLACRVTQDVWLPPLTSGNQAVLFFFVLSGFVLALPYLQGPVPVKGFWIKRVCRIWIPYAAAVLLGLACAHAASVGLDARWSAWLSRRWTTPVDAGYLLQHLLLNPLGRESFGPTSVDPVVWSLAHELRVSLAFPLLMILVLGAGTWVTLGVAMALSLVGLAATAGLARAGIGTDYALTLHYGAMFIVGALVAKHRKLLPDAWSRLGGAAKAAFLVGAYAAVAVAPALAPRLAPALHGLAPGLVSEWPTVAASALAIVVALAPGRLRRILTHPVAVEVGCRSYSLYLTHLVALLATVHLLGGRLPGVWLMLVWVVATTAATFALHHYAERPAIALGRALAAKSQRPPMTR